MRTQKYPILSAAEQDKMRSSAAILRATQQAVQALIRPGVSLLELDSVAEQTIRSMGGKPIFKGFHGFPNTLCTMINNQVVHGIPDRTILQQGDLLSVDCGVVLDGWCTDAAFSLVVGGVLANPERYKFEQTTLRALQAGCDVAIAGNTLGDIGAAVQKVIEDAGYSISKEYTGHGIGKEMHAEPTVYNYAQAPNSRTPLQAGMALCIEPIVLMGSPKTKLMNDGWTVVSADGKDGCQWEHCGIVQNGYFEILA